jgi:hypothetical protein
MAKWDLHLSIRKTAGCGGKRYHKENSDLSATTDVARPDAKDLRT